MSWTDKARISAAAQAIREIRDNTTIGLGSGNTIIRALELVAERIKKENLKITFIPTSYQTEITAKKLGFKTANLEEDTEPDLALDGADQIQWCTLDLVKGGGAALLREKIVDFTSKKLVIIVDEKKLAKTLGGAQPIPVEITPFGYASTVEKIRKISEKTVLREASRSEEHTSELQSLAYLVCRLLLEKKKLAARYSLHGHATSPRHHCCVGDPRLSRLDDDYAQPLLPLRAPAGTPVRLMRVEHPL